MYATEISPLIIYIVMLNVVECNFIVVPPAVLLRIVIEENYYIF